MRKERPGSSGSSPGIKKVVNILTNGKNIAVNADQNISIKELIANKDTANNENKSTLFKLAFDGVAAAGAANNIKQKNFNSVTIDSINQREENNDPEYGGDTAYFGGRIDKTLTRPRVLSSENVIENTFIPNNSATKYQTHLDKLHSQMRHNVPDASSSGGFADEARKMNLKQMRTADNFYSHKKIQKQNQTRNVISGQQSLV